GGLQAQLESPGNGRVEAAGNGFAFEFEGQGWRCCGQAQTPVAIAMAKNWIEALFGLRILMFSSSNVANAQRSPTRSATRPD
ncbi:MAG: hypothetical protein M5R42_21825, partial [Rhodocyclaceae bacterium]|nr:hypothetical protein [Rhodocyclaceae bacterium]